jgi:creatinine amidohydrolase/Fe(II)-dependent formamide hydrolase-like protein
MRLTLFAVAAAVALPLAAPIQAQQLSPPRPPDTVFLEDLTWDELAMLIKAGKTTAILPTAGTEQKGPHMVISEHRITVEFTSDRIARALGNTIVAPAVTYVPEGSWERPGGHMSMAGTITLPDPRFEMLLEMTARSLKGGGFKDILLIGDSGGNRNGMRNVAAKLNAEWKGTGVRVHFLDDYYTKSSADVRRMLTEKGHSEAEIGSHAGMVDTSELMYINPALVRMDKLGPNGVIPNSGVSGNSAKASRELGEMILKIKIDNAVAQARASMAAPPMEDFR